MDAMTADEIEAKAPKLDPKARARLASKLLDSLEALSEEENQQIWLEEARRRDADLDAHPHEGQPAGEIFREARAKLK